MKNFLLFFGLILAFCSFVLADEVILRTGETIKGKVIKDDESGVVIEIAGGRGQITLNRAEVKEVSIDKPQPFILASRFYESGNWEKALELYRKVAQEYSRYRWGQEAIFWIGETNLKLMRWQEAIASYQRIIEENPSTSLSNKAKLGLATAFYNQGNRNRAMEIYKDVFETVEAGEIVAEALYGLGNIYFDQKEYEKALINYLKVVVLHYDQEDSVMKSLFRSAQCFERLDHERARETYEELITQFPKSSYATRAKRRLEELKKEEQR